jgi:hypothetical protein
MSILTYLIDAEISDKNTQFDGKTLTRPTLMALDGQNRTYVCDVDVGKRDPLRNVPIASADGAIRYADIGSAVRLVRSPTGKFEITGYSKRMPGTYTIMPVTIPKIDFGPQLVYGGLAQAANVGQIVVGAPQQVGVTTRALTYDELASFGGYGVMPYGAIALYKDGVFQEIL